MSDKLHIAIFGNPMVDDSAIGHTAELIGMLADGGCAVDVESRFCDSLRQRSELAGVVRRVETPDADTDMIISIGGDGTFLRAVRWEEVGLIPIAGLNGGHLGYLTGWTLDEIPEFVQALSEGCYRAERRSMIKVESEALRGRDYWPYALNEVAVLKESSATMIGVGAEINGAYLTDYDADGLIVATPTGSTGYNLSVGGPILEPSLPAWVLSPVAAHSLNMRPLVVSDDSRLRLLPRSRTHHVLLSLDGRSISVPDNQPLMLTKASFTMAVVRPADATFADTLREKLYWGIGGRLR